MLTTTNVRGALRGIFPTKVVNGTLDAMRQQGIVSGKHVAALSPHDACVWLLGCAAYEDNPARALQAALRQRGWRVMAPAPGHRTTLNHPIISLSDIQLIRMMRAQIVCKVPSEWELSKVEALGHGLAFNRGDYAGRWPAWLPREWKSVPFWIMSEFARHHEPLEGQRQLTQLMLDRIARTLKPPLGSPAVVQLQEAAE